MPPSLETLPKGHQFPPLAFYLSPQWVSEYVAAVEDGAIGGLGPGLVTPMAVVAQAIRALLDSARLPPGAIHLRQEMAFLRPVRAGERLSARARVVSRGERQGWVLMGIDLTVEDEDHGSVMRGRATLAMPLDPAAESQTESMTEGKEEGVAVEAGSELPPLLKELTQEKIDRYARAAGDDNPLHTDPEFAASTQFGGTIAHGMLLLGYLSEVMTAAFGRAWLSGGRLKARFRAPARPGDSVTASGRVLRREAGRTVCAVDCRNQRGEVLVTGEAEVTA